MSKGAQCATIGIQTSYKEGTRECDQLQFFVFTERLGRCIVGKFVLLYPLMFLSTVMGCSAGLCKSPALASTHTATSTRRQVPFTPRFPGTPDLLSATLDIRLLNISVHET